MAPVPNDAPDSHKTPQWEATSILTQGEIELSASERNAVLAPACIGRDRRHAFDPCLCNDQAVERVFVDPGKRSRLDRVRLVDRQ